jgi:hypothetical protein
MIKKLIRKVFKWLKNNLCRFIGHEWIPDIKHYYWNYSKWDGLSYYCDRCDIKSYMYPTNGIFRIKNKPEDKE